MQLNTWIIGDTQHNEYAAAVDLIAALSHVRLFYSLREALKQESWERQANDSPPDLIFLLVSRPGIMESENVDSLKQIAPLARIVAILGSWCEGETRTGSPLPGIVRIFWYDFPHRFPQFVSHLEQGTPGSFDRPGSWINPAGQATDFESLLHQDGQAPPENRGVVAIVTKHEAAFSPLADACSCGNFAAVWYRPDAHISARGIKAAIFDASQLDTQEELQLRRLTGQLADIPVLALLDFPRFDSQQLAIACGADAVAGKPARVEDILWYLQKAVDPGSKQESESPLFSS